MASELVSGSIQIPSQVPKSRRHALNCFAHGSQNGFPLDIATMVAIPKWEEGLQRVRVVRKKSPLLLTLKYSY